MPSKISAYYSKLKDWNMPLQNQTLFITYVNAMSLSYVTGMCGAFKNYVQSHTEALFKLYDIRISFATFFDKKILYFYYSNETITQSI